MRALYAPRTHVLSARKRNLTHSYEELMRATRAVLFSPTWADPRLKLPPSRYSPYTIHGFRLAHRDTPKSHSGTTFVQPPWFVRPSKSILPGKPDFFHARVNLTQASASAGSPISLCI